MSVLACEQCGTAMAMAETLCSQCGTPVPPGRAALVYVSKAERAFEGGQVREAIGHLERALATGLPTDQQGLSWRKLGIWMEKASEGQAELMARAGMAFRHAMASNDADSIAHQLFISNCARQGKISEAKAFYQQRLSANPEDAVALAQMNAVKLNADFLVAPPKVTLNLPPAGVIERWLKPRPWKVASTSLTLIGALIMIVVSLVHGKGDAGGGAAASALSGGLEALTGGGMPADWMSLLFDPWSWTLQAFFSSMLLYFMYRNRDV